MDLKGVLLDREQSAFGLALSARVALPTSTTAVPLGAAGVGWEVSAIFDKRFGNLVAVANVGTRDVPDTALDNVVVSDVLTYRVGGGYALGDAGGLSVDLAGQFAYEELDNPAARTLEAMVGGWIRVAEPLTLRAAVGRGLLGGIGSPAGRAVLTLAWEPGAATPGAAKPVVAKPVASAAPPKRASAPSRPPTADVLIVPGISPLPPGLLHVKVTDPDGRLLDATWAFGVVARGKIVGGLGMAQVSPGPWSIVVGAEGYGTQSLSVDVEPGMTTTLSAILSPARVRVTAEKLELLEKLVWTGKVLDPGSYAVLNEVAATLRAHREITGIRLEGHTDSRGPAEDNLTISGARAAAVTACLVEQGLDPSRFMAAGYGESRPIDLADTPTAWERNQRIELVITRRE